MRLCLVVAAISVLLGAGAFAAELYVSQYPLAYTTISVDGRSVRAMIDTGMQVPLSISPDYAAISASKVKPPVQRYAFIAAPRSTC